MKRAPTTIQARPIVIDACKAAAANQSMSYPDWLERTMTQAALAAPVIAPQFKKALSEIRLTADGRLRERTAASAQ